MGVIYSFFLRFLGIPPTSQHSYPIAACAVTSFHSIFLGPPTFISVSELGNQRRTDIVFVGYIARSYSIERSFILPIVFLYVGCHSG